MNEASSVVADGPYYDDLHQGLVFERPTAVTITSGLTVTYQAISGDSLPLTVNQPLCRQVTGRSELLVNPGLVFSLSIGASTVATKKVIANLFYRNMVLHQQIFLGQTLQTTTSVSALCDATSKPGIAPRGKVALSIRTETEKGNALDYERCALIPCRQTTPPGHHNDVGSANTNNDFSQFKAAIPLDWDLEPIGPHDNWEPNETRHDQLRDVVDNTTALVRLTNNVAAVHRDADASPYGQRLVYGGHTVALAQASVNRTLGGLATLLGWQSCNHLAPVFEQDILSYRHTLIEQHRIGNGTVRWIRVEVDASRLGASGESATAPVLDWVVVALTT